MKRAVILHGTDSNPSENWFPWLKQKLEERGYEVWVPKLPGNHTPNREVYNNFLFQSGWDFTNNIVIGHSSGAVSVLNLLQDERCPHVKMGVMVSAWAKGTPAGMNDEQFEKLFSKDGFNFQEIIQKADKLEFIHSQDDPYCPLEQAKWLAGQTSATITTIPNGSHLGSNFKELPQLWQILEPNL